MFMSSEYSLCPKSTVYFLREKFMSLYNSLCVQFISTEYVLSVKFYVKEMFMSSEYSLCHNSTVYVRVQFMSSEYSLFPLSTVYFLRVQFMSLDHSLCP